jgi:hypothetical protein
MVSVSIGAISCVRENASPPLSPTTSWSYGPLHSFFLRVSMCMDACRSSVWCSVYPWSYPSMSCYTNFSPPPVLLLTPLSLASRVGFSQCPSAQANEPPLNGKKNKWGSTGVFALKGQYAWSSWRHGGKREEVVQQCSLPPPYCFDFGEKTHFPVAISRWRQSARSPLHLAFWRACLCVSPPLFPHTLFAHLTPECSLHMFMYISTTKTSLRRLLRNDLSFIVYYAPSALLSQRSLLVFLLPCLDCVYTYGLLPNFYPCQIFGHRIRAWRL